VGTALCRRVDASAEAQISRREQDIAALNRQDQPARVADCNQNRLHARLDRERKPHDDDGRLCIASKRRLVSAAGSGDSVTDPLCNDDMAPAQGTIAGQRHQKSAHVTQPVAIARIKQLVPVEITEEERQQRRAA
jgi:hypothetical protein